MNIPEIDQKISDLEKQLNDLQGSMEEVRNRFRRSVLDYASNWIKDTLERHLIKENPEKTKQLGKSGIDALKVEFKNVIKQLPKNVNNIINDNKKWPHRTESGFTLKEIETASCKIPDILTEMIRLIISHLGPILKKYELVQFEKYGGWELQGEKVIYIYGINLSPELVQIISNYKERFHDYEKTLKDLTSFKKNKAQEEARILWEKN